MKSSQANQRNQLFNLGAMMVLATLLAVLMGCATVNPGAYEVAAYDLNGKIVRSVHIAVTDDRSLSVPMNAMCVAYPKSKVVARAKDGTTARERQC